MSTHPLSFQLNGKLEQQNHSTIVMLAHTRQTAKDIVKLMKLPKVTVCVFQQFKEDSKVDRKEHKT